MQCIALHGHDGGYYDVEEDDHRVVNGGSEDSDDHGERADANDAGDHDGDERDNVAGTGDYEDGDCGVDGGDGNDHIDVTKFNLTA